MKTFVQKVLFIALTFLNLSKGFASIVFQIDAKLEHVKCLDKNTFSYENITTQFGEPVIIYFKTNELHTKSLINITLQDGSSYRQHIDTEPNSPIEFQPEIFLSKSKKYYSISLPELNQSLIRCNENSRSPGKVIEYIQEDINKGVCTKEGKVSFPKVAYIEGEFYDVEYFENKNDNYILQYKDENGKIEHSYQYSVRKMSSNLISWMPVSSAYIKGHYFEVTLPYPGLKFEECQKKQKEKVIEEASQILTKHFSTAPACKEDSIVKNTIELPGNYKIFYEVQSGNWKNGRIMITHHATVIYRNKFIRNNDKKNISLENFLFNNFEINLEDLKNQIYESSLTCQINPESVCDVKFNSSQPMDFANYEYQLIESILNHQGSESPHLVTDLLNTEHCNNQTHTFIFDREIVTKDGAQFFTRFKVKNDIVTIDVSKKDDGVFVYRHIENFTNQWDSGIHFHPIEKISGNEVAIVEIPMELRKKSKKCVGR